MGRKIPGKKHRGVKDPFKQLAKRQAELETKINAPPKDADDQAIPKSLERIVKLKEAVKSGKITKIKKRKRKKNNVLISVGAQKSKPLHPKAKPDKVVPLFQQKPGETEEQFLHRVERDTHAFLKETQFEKKYGVLVNRNPETGNIEGVTKVAKDELDNIEKLTAKDKGTKKKKKKSIDKPKMTKGQKRKEKLKLKKEKRKEEEVEEFENLKDQVQFGEIVHEPPQIKIGPKWANSVNNAKPGKKDLLLHSVLNKSKESKINSKNIVSMDRTGKRKKLPIGERRQLEKQQSDIIAAYRKLKMQKSTGFNN
ncbi:coiled-coil domain-containing protein 137 [Megachile rotundata]|uniref:coiled-coil domain-containing protein 137 n=1 Tax=Megachile rotundata TaxID=143995 RepID=UPI000258F830|nr:PREDICTED: coiled-coil domain-containing protein 137 [Megachile rotundata]XP_012152619.1 PREDICTED: coiled-coil domain-containing protein 137 [Megachile rotundata]XP_012152620.1 PREDICTED: coiled-coil domain-containing protein 137 [Megachile rotundata]XP_012152621.1 PREDICTED: coiled-coil domain-containing protein 137 [Megachile rotundata]XP_012152622.1 PREDICTED: coiled-coil domain-containing protein 137 [Megachile rotundata]XP_012152623.1 PREDICTED: coiled-coil domain-containing protein 1